ncbi:hypothetical protein [Bacillus marinisedimentorum]|uniref:hypothetical protein n=1 Tax=Bacillus marinisedimentorum TaxID=1821260 RepID=UPI001471C432|nr:hypothetical protein [Bacillus marinisedimentorum]
MNKIKAGQLFMHQLIGAEGARLLRERPPRGKEDTSIVKEFFEVFEIMKAVS